MKIVPSPTRIAITPTPLGEVTAPILTYEGSAESHNVVNDNGVLVDTTTGSFSKLISAEFTPAGLGADLQITNLAPTLTDIEDGVRVVTKEGVTSGLAKIRYKATPRGPTLAWGSTIASPSVVKVSVGYAAGQVGKVIGDVMDAALTNAEDFDLFSAANYPTSWTRSTTHWAKDFDFTGCVVATSMGDTPKGRRGGALITPRHMVSNSHYPVTVGNTVYFVDNTNAVHSRTVVARHMVSGSDRCIHLLSADLPAAVKPFKVFGDMTAHLPHTLDGYVEPPGLMGFWVDQYERVYLVSVAGFLYPTNVVVNGNTYQSNTAQCIMPNANHSLYPTQMNDNLAYGKWPVSGDSGSPILVPWAGELHLCTSWWTTSQGPSYVGCSALLNDIILVLDASAGVSTGHTVTVTNP